MNTNKQGYYGSEFETVYVASNGDIWVVQSADLAAYPDRRFQIAEVPYQCKPLSAAVLDESIVAAGGAIEDGAK